ncbi:MAG: large repetitive protein [Verrucomicrobiota bacterium]
MKHRIASLLTTALILSQPILFVGSVAAATNAVWKSVPGSGDWNTGTNWVSGAAPLFPGDTATFNTSSQLSVSLSSDVSVDTLTFNSGASAFTISVPATISFNFSGPGIVNNSGLVQTINNSGNLLFYGAATSAGTATLNNSGPGSGISFNDGTAGNATINNSGSGSYIEFRTTNGNATVTNSGPNSGVYFYFFNPVSGSAAFNNTNATAFLDCSGSATLVTVGSIAGIGNIFLGNGSKGLVVGTNDADTTFSGLLKDGGAFGGIGGTLTKVGNGTLTLSNANTYTGPTAINSGKLELTGSLLSAVTVSGGAFLDISGASSSAGVGSIAGAGSIFLGGKTLITGTDNTNTTFSGSIQDGGLFGGSGGNLTKAGGGTLILSGANTYTGSTAINAGRLAVNSSLSSGVSIAHGATLGGNGSINAAVTSKGEIAPGLSAGQLTINGDMQLRFPSDLSFEIGGTTPAGQYDVLNKIDNAGLKLNGNLGVTLINGFVPANTDTFTILTTTTPLTGHFNNVLNGTRVNTEDGGGSFIATYSGNNVALSDFGAPIPVSKLLNISTRADVETGDNVTIGGFIITGTAQKKVIIRGLGPSLSNFGLQNVLADPTLELHNAIGALITSNDNWKVNDQTQQSQSAEVSATGLPPSNDPESAIVMMLDPGNYTAILAGKNGATGIGLIEVYDLTSAADSKLANISTRGLVGTGDNVLIGGIIIGPSSGTTKTVLVRALGPSLPNSIANRLLDPTLELHDGTGATIVSNDNWKINQQTDIEDTGLAPSNDNEAAILASLLPGNYTAIVHGAGNTSGVALVEVYDL